MTRLIIPSLILSLFLTLGCGTAYSRYHDRHGHRERYEQRDHHGNKGEKHGHGKKDFKHHGKKIDKREYNHRYDHHKHNKWEHRRPRRIHHNAPPPPPPRLPHMVRHATRGCRDIAVWQIDYDTYIVRYRKGNLFYTRRFYPYINSFDKPRLVSVNWMPQSPWIAIPSIHLNINL